MASPTSRSLFHLLQHSTLIENSKWMLGCPTDTSNSKYPNINLSLSNTLPSLASCYPTQLLYILVSLNQKSLSEVPMHLLIILLYHNPYSLVLHLKASNLPYQVGIGVLFFFCIVHIYF